MENIHISDVISNYTEEENAHLAEMMSDANDRSANAAAAVSGSDLDLLKQMAMMRKGKTLVNDYNVGRNDPCPCGSGLKFKKCCMNTGRYQTKHEL